MRVVRLLSVALISMSACSSAGKSDEPRARGPAASPQPTAATAAPAPADPAVRDDTVLEAVFVHELRAAGARPDEPVCLRVRAAGGKIAEPSAALIAAMQIHFARAIAASGCEGGGSERVRTKTGDDGVISDIGPVVWNGAGVALVEGGGASRGGTMAIREVEYRVEASAGGYKVAAERVLRQN